MKNILYVIGGPAVVAGGIWAYNSYKEQKDAEALALLKSQIKKPIVPTKVASANLPKNNLSASSAARAVNTPMLMSSASAVEQYGAPVVPVDSPVFIDAPYFKDKARIVNIANV